MEDRSNLKPLLLETWKATHYERSAEASAHAQSALGTARVDGAHNAPEILHKKYVASFGSQ